MAGFVESTKEASRGGFQGIKTVRGLQKSVDLVAPPESWSTTKNQIQVSLEDAVILEMFEGEDEFELKDGKFNFLFPYAEEGKKPSANGPYMRCLVASAEKAGKKPSDFNGQVVTFSKVPTVLFKTRNKETKELEDVVTDNYFSYVADEKADSANTKDFIRNLVVGLNDKAALRALLTDTRAKQFPELKDMLKNGTLAGYLELQVIEGKFQKAGD